jgi:hypothetical protein
VGIFIGVQGQNTGIDLSTAGYVIPIEVILETIRPDKKVAEPSSSIDTETFIRQGNEHLLEQNYDKVAAE